MILYISGRIQSGSLAARMRVFIFCLNVNAPFPIMRGSPQASTARGGTGTMPSCRIGLKPPLPLFEQASTARGGTGVTLPHWTEVVPPSWPPSVPFSWLTRNTHEPPPHTTPISLCAAVDGSWRHWDHAELPHWTEAVRARHQAGRRHAPPGDIHAPSYPLRGPYRRVLLLQPL